MEQAREQWGTRVGFLLAAIGSAIGLGNIWRYPYVAYENGGGAFLIPYFIALATAGIPILILEYALGHSTRGSGPKAYRSIRERWEWLGWWQLAVSFVIATYYMVILGWALSYTYFAIGTQWGEDTDAFFFESYLGVGEEFWSLGGIQLSVLVPVLIMWAAVYFVLLRGVRRGIELASRILMPVLVIMLIAIVIRGVTLPGAAEGLNVLLTPDFSALLDGTVWIAAYGQVFFTLSIAFAIMIAYSSYLPRRTDLSNNGFIAALSNCSFEFLAALGVFAVLGFLAVQQNVAVDEVATSGIGLAFIAFPSIINQFPALNSLFGVLFYGSLVFAGFTSAISILEAIISGVRDKFGLSRTGAVNLVCGAAFLVSLIYTTGGGIGFLDIVDHFINNYGLVLSGLVQVLLVGWIARELPRLRDHINRVSDVYVGAWWTISLRFITPLILGAATAYNIYEELSAAYGDYPVSALLTLGGGVALGAVIIGFVLSMPRWRGTETTG
ncbi:sodium-dependent transporter [Rubrobacter taiwanensis]|jgi:NSS family neurotransmitter:Na+ symporter|uniref:Sodium-dependent transporter n=1 Tax=Rubrobacter taiwanensis TaxID=185139 RepID=A0A4R1BM04_9ACTN|nr:sodium-dependent transporter [Rubrobacter taiwanensis]TCJ18453.1 sodium-dependent transporter [Rubrobacter taiwanensis]